MSFLSTRLHMIWSTAHREPTINPLWQSDLYAYIHGILENKKSQILAIGGISDHIHVYASLPPTLSIAQLANAIKSNSSSWVHENHLPTFAWQAGYAAFTMSKSADHDVCHYIRTQVEHHKTTTFQDELLMFLKKFDVPYDPKYIFE